MKAILQMGPAQFIIEGATFHLLCENIQQTLVAMRRLQECNMILKLHVERLEARLVEDAHRLRAAGVALPKALPNDGGDDDDDSTVESSLPFRVGDAWRSAWQRRVYVNPAAPMQHYECSTTGQQQPVVHRRPLFIFSAASFDVAETVVQRLHARLLEQRLLLDEIELQALCSGSDDCSASDASTRVLPLPVMELDTYSCTSTNVMPEYGAARNHRRSPTPRVGTSAYRRY
ncbi:hypothetical protein, unknown function [Leishmania tarentolae]|uniref:Uncharacterized protein n=1 Tax=Leishmania tarentolae TaxID=5689 RepID=A0A640KEY7_LEITA|nr:hypothetical protein, unknown function [Leishmania tarentolae]